MPQLDGSVELLERSLAYTRVRLHQVDEDHLDGPTPCVGWTLADLLGHMGDALDAFAEAAGGAVRVLTPPASAAPGRVAVIQQKACALLGAWSRPAPGDVRVGGVDLATPLLLRAAALEITVHGWDVGVATGDRAPVPRELAAALVPVARELVAPADRPLRFAAARPVAAGAGPGAVLLAHLGRAV